MKKFWAWLTGKNKKPTEAVTPKPVEVTPPVTSAPTTRAENPAYNEAKKYEGKKETDYKFVAFLAPYWKKVGLPNYKQLSGSTYAWCALFVFAMGNITGVKFVASPAAIDLRKSGIEIDWKNNGIPRGAIVGLNHKGECLSGSNNHVGFADGDCAWQDLFDAQKKLKKGVNIKIYGGNQSDQVKTSSYSTTEICAVRWPAEITKPGKITKSINCAGAKDTNESTR